MRVYIAIARIKREQAFAVCSCLRARKGRIGNNLQLIVKSLVRVDLIAANFYTGDPGQGSSVYLKGDDQTFTVERNTLEHINPGVAITEIAHVAGNRSFVLLEQSEASVATTISKQ